MASNFSSLLMLNDLDRVSKDLRIRKMRFKRQEEKPSRTFDIHC